MLAKERKRVVVKPDTMEGVKFLRSLSLNTSHSILYPPAEHKINFTTFSATLSIVRKMITKWIKSKTIVAP